MSANAHLQVAACGLCRFYCAEELECRLHAPVFHGACGSIYPQDMKSTDWCGDFQSRDGFGWRFPNDTVREEEECPF